ncbi:ABC transporter substrate-binding protein [Bacillus cihuensis]|uniref:ABC transporter substrate-binding protein n=1 Tax=Bacillus cihuensis TaxID=1208599 RepID=UPI00041EF09E|nr:ABC transporter substrate-binding protein [Bacillus cihuensis]
MNKSRLYISLSLLLLFATILSGCSENTANTSSNNQGNEGGTLIVGLGSDVDVLDPTREGGWETFRVNRQIHESLVTEDLSKSSVDAKVPALKPQLAKSWDISEDGLTYTFHLREGVKFHDGTVFNAEAVEFNIRRSWDQQFEYYDQISASKMALTYQSLKDINIVDEYTIQLILKEPFSPLLRMLAQGSWGTGLILSPTALKRWGNDGYGEHPTGTGPFKFVERIRGEKIEIARFNDYWGDKAHVDKVIFRPIPDAVARVTALETGEVDIISSPFPDSVAQLKEKGFNIGEGDIPEVFYFSFNFNNPYFKDQKIRQAFIHAIDRVGLTKNLLKDTASPAYGIQSPGNEAYDPAFQDYTYDPNEAKALLKEAGYPDGFTTTLQTYAGTEAVAEWVQRDLAKVGIKLNIETYEWNSYLSEWGAGMKEEVGLNSMSWGFVTPYWLYIVAHSESGSNVGKYHNPSFDEAVNSGIHEVNPEKAIEYWKKANEIVSENAAVVPLSNNRTPYAFGKNVEGFVVPAQDWYDLHTVWLKK